MADLTIKYKGQPIVEMAESGTKTLKTAGKYCEDDISVEYVKPAGGGGGSGDNSGGGGDGGGITGGRGKNTGTNSKDEGEGGTQTTGYAFGQGGDGGIYGYAAGGGGGWYGGYGGTSYSGNGTPNGGGGSGYINTILTNAQTIAGNASMPAPAGSTETGHTGNGYARITLVK